MLLPPETRFSHQSSSTMLMRWMFSQPAFSSSAIICEAMALSVFLAGGSVTETSLRSPNLETLFLLLTGKELRE